mgnify:CR=1 FL=1
MFRIKGATFLPSGETNNDAKGQSADEDCMRRIYSLGIVLYELLSGGERPPEIEQPTGGGQHQRGISTLIFVANIYHFCVFFVSVRNIKPFPRYSLFYVFLRNRARHYGHQLMISWETVLVKWAEQRYDILGSCVGEIDCTEV